MSPNVTLGISEIVPVRVMLFVVSQYVMRNLFIIYEITVSPVRRLGVEGESYLKRSVEEYTQASKRCRRTTHIPGSNTTVKGGKDDAWSVERGRAGGICGE